MKCPKLRDKRTDILNRIYSKYKNLSSLNTGEVFIWLMSSEDPFILRNISKLLIVLFPGYYLLRNLYYQYMISDFVTPRIRIRIVYW